MTNVPIALLSKKTVRHLWRFIPWVWDNKTTLVALVSTLVASITNPSAAGDARGGAVKPTEPGSIEPDNEVSGWKAND